MYLMTQPTDKDADQCNRNSKIIDKIKTWQSFQYVRPLMCKRCNVKLVPKVHKRSGKVCLRCSKCNFLQWSIPSVVLQARLVVYEHAKPIKRNIKIKKRKSDKSSK